jgi:hypothetical protein
MASEEEKLDKIIGMLRESGPELRDSHELISQILVKAAEHSNTPDQAGIIYNWLFGWVWIGWVRKSMVAVSFVLLTFLGTQQAMIIVKKGSLSSPSNLSDLSNSSLSLANMASEKGFIKLFSSNSPGTQDSAAVESFIRSLGTVQEEYSDILKALDKDPELKRYVRKRLLENKIKSHEKK